MKTFKLHSVQYKNIMSIGNPPIYIDLQSHHKTLITGVNGAGKSTMLEAITFALFGKQFRDIKLGQLINSITKKNLLVNLTLEYDSHIYTITRGQKPAIFEVTKDGVPLEQSTEFQTEFEDMIGMNYNSFKQVVVLGTAGYKPFMELNKPDRRKLVEDLLEVSVLADMDKANKALVKAINAEIGTVDIQINHTNSQIKTHEEYTARQVAMSGDNVQRLQNMFNECVKKITSIRDTNNELNDQLLNFIVPLDPSSEITAKHRELVENEGKYNTYNNVLTLYKRGGSCPSCMQQLCENDLTSKIESNATGLSFVVTSMKEDLISLNETRKKYLEIVEKSNKIKNEIASNTSMAQNEAERAKKIQLAINEAKKEIVDNSNEVEVLKIELSKLIDKKSNLVTEKHQRTYIVDMLKDSGIKGSIIKRYVPMFNKQINYYLSIMEADYSFTLNEEFVETIKSRGRESFSYSSFSQGEKARIDLAMLFTWRDVAEKISGVRINCLFLDEVADGSTDAQGVKTIQQILNDKSESNIFIISHRDHNPEDYNQHLKMKKVGRFTVME